MPIEQLAYHRQYDQLAERTCRGRAASAAQQTLDGDLNMLREEHRLP